MKQPLIMNGKDIERFRVMLKIKSGYITLKDASKILSISYRQTRRIYKRFIKEGIKGILHKSIGKKSNNSIDLNIKQDILNKYRQCFCGLGPTSGKNKLKAAGYDINRETLRTWLIEEGLWQVKKRSGSLVEYRKK